MDQKSKKLIVFLAGEIRNKANVRNFISSEDFDFIAADGGYLLANEFKVPLSLILGDFDSSAMPFIGETVVYPCEKDDTDSALALQHGIQKGYTEICMIAPFGGRFDHSLANLALFETAEKHNVALTLYDGENLVQSLKEGEHTISNRFRYVSFLPWDASATVTLSGFKYPLDYAELYRAIPLGVSNEPLENPIITVHHGKIICICIEKTQEGL